MKKIWITTIVLIALLSVSCEKMMFEKDKASTDPYVNFDYLWEQCDRKYSYFDVKQIDWDRVKTDFRAKLYEGMSEEELFNVLGGMLNELRDDHTNLMSYFNISIFGVQYKYPPNYDWRVIHDHYLTDSLQYTGPFTHDYLAGGRIGYVRLPEFTGDITTDGSLNIDYILRRFRDTEGLILDLRDNGGGVSADVFALLSRFVDKKTLLYYSRIRNGPEHNDFSDPEPVYVEPHDSIRYLKPVVVLVDRGTFSAASFTSLSIKAIDHMILMGDTTGGGLGMPNGGQLPNGWLYRFSITQALNLEKSSDWENGVPPDVYVQFNWDDLSRDEILDRALEELQAK